MMKYIQKEEKMESEINEIVVSLSLATLIFFFLWERKWVQKKYQKTSRR